MSDEVKQKRPVGRPSKYLPEYCEQIIELGKQGKSIAQMASFFDVDKASIFRWSEEHEDFRTSLARARAHSQTWWEDKCQGNLADKNFNAQLWLKSVTARFKDDYTDQLKTEITGANGGAVQIETKKVDTDALEPEQLDTLRELILAAKGVK